MSKNSDKIINKIILSIAKKDKVYVEGDSSETTLEKLRVKRRQRTKKLHSNNPIGESKKMKDNRQEKEIIKSGSWVTWTSQSQGSAKRKEGEILAYVPRGTKVPLNGVDTSVPSRMQFDPEQTSVRDRYLVKVLEKQTIRYFTPIASLVVPMEQPVEPLIKQQDKEKFGIGSRVMWEFRPGDSQPMEGEILAFVPAHTNIPLEGLNLPALSKMNSDQYCKAEFDRYLVAVQTKRTTHYYTPSVSSVSAVNQNSVEKDANL